LTTRESSNFCEYKCNARRNVHYRFSGSDLGRSTLEEVCSVIPSKICCEISATGIDPALAIEFLIVTIQYDLVFAGELDTNAIIGVAVGRVEVEYP